MNEQRRIGGRIGGLTKAATGSTRESTEAARAAFLGKFAGREQLSEHMRAVRAARTVKSLVEFRQ